MISGEQGNGLNFSKEFTSGEGTKAAIAIAEAIDIAAPANMNSFGLPSLHLPEAIATASSRLEFANN
jgi:hypothetical protein